jgi:hypothetical protein
MLIHVGWEWGMMWPILTEFSSQGCLWATLNAVPLVTSSFYLTFCINRRSLSSLTFRLLCAWQMTPIDGWTRDYPQTATKRKHYASAGNRTPTLRSSNHSLIIIHGQINITKFLFRAARTCFCSTRQQHRLYQ